MLTPGFAETNALIAVLEQKSFTKAAKKLGLSVARTSELVRGIEERLGVRLVERTTRSVSATDAGQRLVERLRPLLDDYQAAYESLNDFRAKPVGTVRLTVPQPAADFVLAPVIGRFLAQYREITLELSIDRAYVDIVAERFDAGIRPGERVDHDMVAVRVSDEIPIVTVASPAYLKRRGSPTTPQELSNHACMRFRLPNGTLLPWRFRKKGRLFEVQVEAPLIANEAGIAIRAAAEGAGLIQLPLPYVDAEIAGKRLVPVLVEWAPPGIDAFFLYYSNRRQMRPPLKALVDFLRDSYRRSSTQRTSRSPTNQP